MKDTKHFRHDRENRRSYVVVPPNKAQLLQSVKGLKTGNQIKRIVGFQMGIARLHPGDPKRQIAPDKFCRRLGRENAVLNMKMTFGLLETVIIEAEGVLYNVRVGKDRVTFFRHNGQTNVMLDDVITRCYGE